MPLLVKKLDPRATLPTCAHPGEDLAYDLFALEDTLLLPLGTVNKVRTGVALSHGHLALGGGPSAIYYMPQRDGLLIKDRSSMASKGITVSGGVIDAGYRGEIIVLMNSALLAYELKAGDKIAQVIPTQVLTGDEIVQVDEFMEELTARGDAGFGSTGR